VVGKVGEAGLVIGVYLLTEYFSGWRMVMRDMINEQIANSMLQEFAGCDSDNPGSPDHPAIWMFGIEPGYSKNDSEKPADPDSGEACDNYPIAKQIQWPFNRGAFKLLAAINGVPVEDYRSFAELHQPFVRNRGNCAAGRYYFKGNLYPYACHTVEDWPEDAQLDTGIADKEVYRQWCRDYRLPTILKWVDRYRPALFIGVGKTCRQEFSLAVFGREVDFREKEFVINTFTKTLYYFVEGDKRLIIIPHFASRYGLNSNEALRQAGEFIGGLMRE
jgi:hypothetical protein